MRSRRNFMIPFFAALLFLVAKSVSADPTCQSQIKEWRIIPNQFGCYNEIRLCVIGPEDVANLPDNGGTLGIKTLGSDYVRQGDFVLKFKVFEIFDIGRDPESPLMSHGKKIMHVDTFAFNSEEALRRYIASRKPGEYVYVSFGDLERNQSDFVCLRVLSEGDVHFETNMPDYVTYEQGVKIARDQSISAFLSVSAEVAPYAMLYLLGTKADPDFIQRYLDAME